MKTVAKRIAKRAPKNATRKAQTRVTERAATCNRTFCKDFVDRATARNRALNASLKVPRFKNRGKFARIAEKGLQKMWRQTCETGFCNTTGTCEGTVFQDVGSTGKKVPEKAVDTFLARIPAKARMSREEARALLQKDRDALFRGRGKSVLKDGFYTGLKHVTSRTKDETNSPVANVGDLKKRGALSGCYYYTY